ncbi:hypothetical protein CAEBREN_17521 [Caenorhabditis brenneri]|uniref:Uncharacterized protein n=1 Tax=Caenorhabditis brenneri TaxID=135651 RepID=G0P1L4_CAEBE|nr:hypothetical protein CAEBREN_17521 [Caenorhabditis brenneri]
MAEFNFLKYCKLTLTVAGYPSSAQVEILELGDVLRNVVEANAEVRGANATAGAGTPDEGNVAQLLKSLGMENFATLGTHFTTTENVLQTQE